MSEPSLRSTVIRDRWSSPTLMVGSTTRELLDPAASRMRRCSVIHTQRDAIATAVAPLIDQMIECGPLSAENFQRGVDGAADAVLAMLDGTVGE